MENLFESFFSEKTIRYPSFIFTGVDAKSLDKFKQVVIKVQEKTKSKVIELDYDVMSSNLTVKGTALDLFYFGYYTKELEQ